MYHAEKEVGTAMSKSVNESHRAAAHDPIERVKWALLEKEDDEYARLLEGVQDVMTVLEDDIGSTSVISRTKQHLYGQVIALRVAQEDHLETEEAMVLPLIKENLSPECQLEVVAGLLVDRDADGRLHSDGAGVQRMAGQKPHRRRSKKPQPNTQR